MNRHFNFADLFELAADTVPDRVAGVERRRRVTYAELEEIGRAACRERVLEPV